MGNATHIDGIWAMAVALGVGMAVVNTPAVALAAPADSGANGSPGTPSSSSSSPDSGSTSLDTPSAAGQSSATNNVSNRRRALNAPGGMAVSSSGGALTSSTAAAAMGKPGEVAAAGPHTTTTTGSSASPATTVALAPMSSTQSTGSPGADARQNGESTFRPGSQTRAAVGPAQPINALSGSGFTSAQTTPAPAAVIAPAADPPAPASSPDPTPSAAAPTSFTAAAAAIAPDPPASMVSAPTTADPPVSDPLSTLINAVLSPFANTAPTTPGQTPAMFTLLAFARREFEQAFSIPSTIVNPLAGQITTGSAVDPDFISSTHNLGPFSMTSAADPDDNDFVAVVFTAPLVTDILTSGADPEDNLGFGAAGIGVAGHTVNTFISPFLTFSVAIPVTDPFAKLFTALVQSGLA